MVVNRLLRSIWEKVKEHIHPETKKTKREITELLINGQKFLFKEVDYRHPDKQRDIQKLKQQQADSKNRKNIDWETINTYEFKAKSKVA